jgi:hypothetical protein
MPYSSLASRLPFACATNVLTIAAGATGASVAGAVIVISTPARAAKVSQKILMYEGVTEDRDVSGHTKGKAELRKLRAARNPIILQNGGWNCRRARLVRGLGEEAGNRIHCTSATGAARFRVEPSNRL